MRFKGAWLIATTAGLLGTAAALLGAAPKDRPRKAWEYQFVRFDEPYEPKAQELGAEGWGVWLYFKREKQP